MRTEKDKIANPSDVEIERQHREIDLAHKEVDAVEYLLDKGVCQEHPMWDALVESVMKKPWLLEGVIK